MLCETLDTKEVFLKTRALVKSLQPLERKNILSLYRNRSQKADLTSSPTKF